MDIPDNLRHALRNLSRKSVGNDVDFINIADAQALTALGLAARSRQGWDITPAGLLALNGMPPVVSEGPSSVTQFPGEHGAPQNDDQDPEHQD
jgi:hypothetical protein